MPTKPKRPCSYPACPALTDGPYCDTHVGLVAKHYERYQRDPAAKKRYGRQWQKIRDQFIAAHPVCQKCTEQNQLTPAEEVHHIIPLSQGGTHDWDNLVALCTSCHSRITATEGGRWQRR